MSLEPKYRCPLCQSPYWLPDLTCVGRYEHHDGRFVEHERVDVVPIVGTSAVSQEVKR